MVIETVMQRPKCICEGVRCGFHVMLFSGWTSGCKAAPET